MLTCKTIKTPYRSYVQLEKNDNNSNEFSKNGNDYICMTSSFFSHKCLSHVYNTRADGNQQNQTGAEQFAIPFRFA